MKKIVGIDIGGTMIKYALLSLEGDILKKGEIPTEASKGVENLFSNISKVIEGYLSEDILGMTSIWNRTNRWKHRESYRRKSYNSRLDRDKFSRKIRRKI